jgi:hypothetical protein
VQTGGEFFELVIRVGQRRDKHDEVSTRLDDQAVAARRCGERVGGDGKLDAAEATKPPGFDDQRVAGDLLEEVVPSTVGAYAAR